MASLLNQTRPPVFCPGCAHEMVVRALDKSFQNLGLEGNQICIVTDIGCSGLFDTFFNTHALHGVHGRALTYATGIKLCRPDLKVVVTMGDGGLGIGGAHLLAACRRNLDLTLLVLNNFNFGMTGGQCSVTSPADANLASGFLNQLEKPMELLPVATAAGIPFMATVSTADKNLGSTIERALTFHGMSAVEIQGVCPGRYTKRNALTPMQIQKDLERRGYPSGPVPENLRTEYGEAYHQAAGRQKAASPPSGVSCSHQPVATGRQEIVILGSAGQRVITAGELLATAAMSTGFRASLKADYDITVLRGLSVAEIIISPAEIDYTVIENPSIILALANEGVSRRAEIFDLVTKDTRIIRAEGVDIPSSEARVETIDFKAAGLKPPDWALAGLAIMAKKSLVMNLEMLEATLTERFKGDVLVRAKKIVEELVI